METCSRKSRSECKVPVFVGGVDLLAGGSTSRRLADPVKVVLVSLRHITRKADTLTDVSDCTLGWTNNQWNGKAPGYYP